MTADAFVARHLTVHGRVQGVFFRASLRDEAVRLGVTGWARNLPDGAVEAWLEGATDVVDAVEAWVRGGGPPAAAVERLDVDERTPAGHRSFTIG